MFARASARSVTQQSTKYKITSARVVLMRMLVSAELVCWGTLRDFLLPLLVLRDILELVGGDEGMLFECQLVVGADGVVVVTGGVVVAVVAAPIIGGLAASLGRRLAIEGLLRMLIPVSASLDVRVSVPRQRNRSSRA